MYLSVGGARLFGWRDVCQVWIGRLEISSARSDERARQKNRPHLKG